MSVTAAVNWQRFSGGYMKISCNLVYPDESVNPTCIGFFPFKCGVRHMNRLDDSFSHISQVI